MRKTLLQISLLFLMPVVAAQTKTPAWKNGSHETMCGLGTYQDGLDLAFKNSTEASGETLLTVEVLASFQREYALVLTRVGSEVNLLRARFQTQLWTQLTPLQDRKTRQQCLALASAATLDTVTIPARPETMSQLLSSFRDIRLSETDSCPRRGKECDLAEDGTAYVVLSKSGPPVRITETSRLKGIRNENTALLDWIHSLLQAASSSKPQ